MTQITLGDQTQAKVFNQRNATLKDSIQNLSIEVTTGLTAKMSETVHGNYSELSGIEASLTRLSAFKTVTSETGAMANQMQLALNNLSDSGSALSSALLSATTSNSESRLNAVGGDADQRLRAALSVLNTRFASASIFAGNANNNAAVADADTMMAGLQTAISGALSAADVATAVDTWFADPAGYAATVYQGGDPQGGIDIAEGQRVQIGVTAKDPAITSLLKGMAMAALLGRGVLAGDLASRADLAKRAGESLSNSLAPLVDVTARIGIAEATIQTASMRNDAEKSALEIARLGVLSVDPYEAASKLQDAQSQLETLYSVTARMSRLSLVNYL